MLIVVYIFPQHVVVGNAFCIIASPGSTFTIHFYRTSTGACPVEQFLESLNVKMRAKALYSLEILEEFGCNLKEPHSKYLDHGQKDAAITN